MLLVEEEFELSDLLWCDWAPEFTAWVQAPVFGRFEEIERWMAESPPRDAGCWI